MNSECRIGVALAACLLLTVSLIFVSADPTAPSGPTVNAPPTASVGVPLLGDASDNGDPVVVEVFCEGLPVPGLRDDTMDGDDNQFDFVLPESCRNKDIEIVATDLDGNETRRIVHVN